MIQKLRKGLPILFSVLTLGLAAALIAEALTMSGAGYTPHGIAQAGGRLTPLAALWLCAGLAAFFLCPRKEKTAPKGKMKALQPPPHHLKAVRVGLYILGTALVVLGVINGGLRDVMYKAITICTECIGLG